MKHRRLFWLLGIKAAEILDMGQNNGNSKDFIVYEAICGFAGSGILLWMFWPKFRFWADFILVTTVFLSVAVVIFRLIAREYHNEPTESSFEASPFTSNPPNASSVNPTSPVSVATKPAPALPVPALKIAQKLRKISWLQLEKLIGLIYQHQGYSVERLGEAKPDGGADLILESAKDKFVVQCKHWRKWTVGVGQIREFLDALTESGISKGIFVTLAGCSEEATQLAAQHDIQILNQMDVVQMLEEAGLLDSKEILQLFADTKKLCPKCKTEMVLRTNLEDGTKFWGCSNFPRCWGRLDFQP